MPRRRFGVGDVFRLEPYGEDRHGYGQILGRYGAGHFYVGVFSSEYRGDQADLDSVIDDPFALFALALDALLHHGRWAVVGTAPVPQERFRWPEYKLSTAPDRYVVVDAFGAVVRPAGARDVALLPYRTVVAPILVQHAFEALHGQREWLPAYEELRV